jgi:hypothetical protein
LLVGGRYHITHLWRNTQGFEVSGQVEDVSSVVVAVGVFVEGAEALPLSLLSAGTAGLLGVAALLKSKAVPGVFGVFPEPNPNAPDPRPNALDAPVLAVGEDMPAVVKGVMLLNGLERPPWELVGPSKRLVGNWRVDWSLRESVESPFWLESGSLLELE